jgi:hypothetical protein
MLSVFMLTVMAPTSAYVAYNDKHSSLLKYDHKKFILHAPR